MHFLCSNCQAKYNVDDSRLPAGKTIRITCKKCGSLIRLCGTTILEGAIPQDAAGNNQATTSNEASDLRNSLGEATKITSPEELAEFRASMAQKIPQTAKPGRNRWYILIGQNRQGPLTQDQIAEKCQAKVIDQHTLVWHKGMGNWQRLAEIEEFAELAKSTGTAPWRVVEPITDEQEQNFIKDQQDALIAATSMVKAVSPEALPDELSLSALDSLMDAPPEANIGRVVNSSTTKNTAPFAPTPMEPVSTDYYNAPPGESTRIFFATAGIYKRRKQQKIAAICIGCFFMLLISFIIMDAKGLIQLPGMGALYEKTDRLDPNKERGIERIQTKLARTDITPEEREALRKKLHLYEEVDVNSLSQVNGKKGGKGKNKKGKVTATTTQSNEYHEEFKEAAPPTKGTQQDLLAAMYNDDRKKDTKVELNLNNKVSVSDLPAGLTQEAITQVIGDGKGALRLCTAEAMKAGEKISGRMEVEFTIHGSGKVTEVVIPTKKFKDTKMASCVSRSIKRWSFPKFNGEPVTVSYPIIITLGI